MYEEDETGYGPSTRIVPILRSALRYKPNEVDQAIAEAFHRVRPTVQADLTDVYQLVNRQENHVSEPHASQLSDIVVKRLLTWVRQDHLAIAVRIEAIESLESAYSEFPGRAADDFETLLGYLAIVSAQENPGWHPPTLAIPGQPGNRLMDILDESTNSSQWATFKQKLLDCLEALSQDNASGAIQAISDCLGQPMEQINGEFKAGCVSILGNVADKYDIRPQTLPYLWRALMDYGSPRTRAAAIDATIKMFRNGVSPPPNLVEIILIHLSDPYAVVHQAALRAVTQRRYWFGANQTGNLLSRLESHINAYREEAYQLPEICDAVMTTAQADKQFKAVALYLIKKVFPSGKGFVDRRIAHHMIRFCEPSEAIAAPVAKLVAAYFREHARDQHNHSTNSDRVQMLAWLRHLPAATFRQTTDDLLDCALHVAERDTWEACCFAGVFAHFMEFRHERQVLEVALNSIPDEVRHTERRELIRRLLEAAAINAILQSDQPEEPVEPQPRR